MQIFKSLELKFFCFFLSLYEDETAQVSLQVAIVDLNASQEGGIMQSTVMLIVVSLSFPQLVSAIRKAIARSDHGRPFYFWTPCTST